MGIFRSKRSAEPTMSDITNDNEGLSEISPTPFKERMVRVHKD